jgi:hypothetical protein
MKIRLLEYWLSNPDKMGDIPKKWEESITTDDFFSIKKEMGWKPLTPENVRRLLHKTKYTEIGGVGKGKENPRAGLIIAGIMILPILFSIFSGLAQSVRYSDFLPYMIAVIIFLGIFLRFAIFSKLFKK